MSIYDYGRDQDGRLFIAMEYVDGQSLQELVDEGGPLPAHATLHLLRRVAGASSLGVAGSLGVDCL